MCGNTRKPLCNSIILLQSSNSSEKVSLLWRGCSGNLAIPEKMIIVTHEDFLSVGTGQEFRSVEGPKKCSPLSQSAGRANLNMCPAEVRALWAVVSFSKTRFLYRESVLKLCIKSTIFHLFQPTSK